MIDKRVSLVGCPRSGTTLLQSMLHAYPSICSLPETSFFDSMTAIHMRVTKFAAAIPGLAVLAPIHSPAHEFFIRFWYDTGAIRELFSPRAGMAAAPKKTER